MAVLGDSGRLPAIVRLLDVERIIVAFSNDSHEETIELLRSVKDLEVQIDIVPRLFEFVGPGVEIHTIEGLPLVGLPPLRLSRSSRLLKRATDLALTIPTLVVLAPVLALLALMIKIDSPGPVFFRQVRVGAAGQTFRIFKFRSMHADAEERKHEVAHLNRHLAPGGDPRMFKIVGDPRVTRVGKFLRRFSLDELPQLLNVVIGQMSLVGPRPLILDEDQLRRTMGAPAAESQAWGDGPMAGARAERDSVRGDGPSRLPLRHPLVVDGRSEVDGIDDPGARADAPRPYSADATMIGTHQPLRIAHVITRLINGGADENTVISCNQAVRSRSLRHARPRR